MPPHLSKHLWRILAVVAGFFIFWGVFLAVKKEDLLIEIEEFGLAKLGLFFGIAFFVFLLNALRWYVILAASGSRVGPGRLFKLKLITYPVSFLTPTTYFGSEPLRVHYLSKDKKIRPAQAWASVLIEGFFELFVKGVLVALVVLYLLSEFIFSRRLELALIFSAVLWLAFLLLVFYRLLAKRQFLGFVLQGLEKIVGIRANGLLQDFKDIDDNFLAFFEPKNFRLWQTLFVSLALVFLQFFELYVLLTLAGLALPFSLILILRILMFAAELTPIPMFLGSAEFLQILFFSLYALPAHFAIFIPLMYRAVGLFYSLIGTGLWLEHVFLRRTLLRR